jgi:hypothetical protein
VTRDHAWVIMLKVIAVVSISDTGSIVADLCGRTSM